MIDKDQKTTVVIVIIINFRFSKLSLNYTNLFIQLHTNIQFMKLGPRYMDGKSNRTQQINSVTAVNEYESFPQ